MSLKRVNFSPLHTFVRATVKNVFQPEPDGFGGTEYILKEVASGAPAFAWNPETGESLGISIEEARTNYITNNTTGLAWTTSGSGVVVTERTETVKGVSCRVLNVVHDGSAIGGLVIAPTTMPSSANVSPSFFVKNISGTSSLAFRDSSSASNGNMAFNNIPSDGEFHRVGAGISDVTVLTQYNTNTKTKPNMYFASNVAREFEVCMPMMEVGTNTSSLILTSGSTVTRLADVVTVPDLSGWFNASEGTFVVEFEAAPQVLNTNPTVLSVNNGSITNRILLYQASLSGLVLSARQSGATTIEIVLNNDVAGGKNKVAFRYTTSGLVVSCNGGAVQSGSGAIPASLFSQMNVGCNATGANLINGTIANIQYYPQAVSDTQLQELSAL